MQSSVKRKPLPGSIPENKVSTQSSGQIGGPPSYEQATSHGPEKVPIDSQKPAGLAVSTEPNQIPNQLQQFQSPVELDEPGPEEGGTDEDPEFEQWQRNDLSQDEHIPDPDEQPAGEASPKPSKWKSILSEASYLAGGLVTHPVVSNKNYSILRHSHGFVRYQGPATSLAISVFSYQPLPPDRRFFLQNKGWTGNRGMRFKSFFRLNGSWIEVTPQMLVGSDDLPPKSERAWRRDIDKFLRKGQGYQRDHFPRETCVIRIPSIAQDGYFRIVMCFGDSKKVICSSPTFRIGSMTLSASSIRGASLGTLPLEVGLKTLSIVTNNAAANLLSPATGAFSNLIAPYRPGFLEQAAGQLAFDGMVQPEVDTMNQSYADARDGSYNAIDPNPGSHLSQGGPVAPFPITLPASCEVAQAVQPNDLLIQTITLHGVPDDMKHRLTGMYMAWFRIKPRTSSKPAPVPGEDPLNDWIPCLVEGTVIAGVVPKKRVTLHILDAEFEIDLTNVKIVVTLMGFLHPPIASDPVPAQTLNANVGPNASTAAAPIVQPQLDRPLAQLIADSETALSTFASPNWAPPSVHMNNLPRSATMSSSSTSASGPSTRSNTSDLSRIDSGFEKLTSKYVSARTAVQSQVDRVPLHMAGVRRTVDELRDRAIGMGGVYVKRGVVQQ